MRIFRLLTENDRKRYFDLYDLAAEVDSLKNDNSFGSAFAYFDSSTGINEFVRKLPKRFRERWITVCDKHKVENKVSFVCFNVIVKFLQDLARIRNDPSLMLENELTASRKADKKSDVNVRKVTVTGDSQKCQSDSDTLTLRCPIHGAKSNHALRDCHKLKKKPYKERIDFLFNKGYCLIQRILLEVLWTKASPDKKL